MTQTVYVTKWVIYRGILALPGIKRDDEMSKRWRTTSYFVSFPHGNNWRNNQLTLGTECFLTLEEAQADAQKRFEVHAAKTQVEAKRAQEALQRLARGELQVHRKVGQIKVLHAFEPAGVR